MHFGVHVVDFDRGQPDRAALEQLHTSELRAAIDLES
jgi:hypothetical protein